MKTIQHPENWLMRLGGLQDLPRILILSQKEIAILRQAQQICERAHEMIIEDEDEQTDYAWASIYLNNILEGL